MKLAFVIPWCGPDIPGGAEGVCWSTAVRLREAGVPVEILTTCIKQFRSDWSKNYHRAGTVTIGGIPVRRFRVGSRDTGEFARINQRLMQRLPVTTDEESTFVREMVRCDDLIHFIEAGRGQYVYAYIPYMFSTTYFGVLACPDSSVLLPCLHDESYAYLNLYKPVFERARGIVFHSRAEMALANRLFVIRPGAQALLGAGIDTDLTYRPERFRRVFGLDRFLLYAGRKDDGKNVSLLVDYFCRYKELNSGALKLVLIGDGSVNVPAVHKRDVVDLGFVSARDKRDAFAAATALCQPSVNESFSIVMMEAWLAGTPALVHAECAVTSEHCLASKGGLYFSSFEDFMGCVDYLLENHDSADRMARNGRDYVLANYTWDRMVRKYLAAIRRWGFAL
jgi:glycosyltransferase involved in cell wall biosynthesis